MEIERAYIIIYQKKTFLQKTGRTRDITMFNEFTARLPSNLRQPQEVTKEKIQRMK